MTGYEIASIIGAAAWLPPVFSWVKDWRNRSKINVITQSSAEVGFTTYGPIFNLRIAFSAKNKEIVITKIQFKVSHERGDKRIFSWQGMKLDFGSMTQIMNNMEPAIVKHEKEQSVLALKILPYNMEERSIRFQDDDFIQTRKEIAAKLRNKLDRLKSTGSYNIQEVSKLDEINDLSSCCIKHFCWQAGEYKADLIIGSTEQFDLLDKNFSFRLEQADIELLRKNEEIIKGKIFEEFCSDAEGYTKVARPWNWLSPVITKC